MRRLGKKERISAKIFSGQNPKMDETSEASKIIITRIINPKAGSN
jgi:hypothetical protein